MTLPRVVDLLTGEWQEHPRFPGIFLKALLNTSDNPLATVNAIRVPPGGEIGRHRHLQQIETIWIIKGNPILTLDQTEVFLRDGQIIAIPIELEHTLRNESSTPVELLAFFTPPLT